MSDPRLYIVKEYKLQPNTLGERLIIDYVFFDTMYMETYDGDSTKVWIAIDDHGLLSLFFLAQGVQLKYGKPEIHKLVIRWESSEDGKTLILVFGRDMRLIMFRPPQGIRILSDHAGLAKEFTQYNPWYRDLQLFDVIVPSTEVWNVGGNMYWSFNALTVQGTMIVSDQALVRAWNGVTIDGGRMVIQDNAQVVSEVVV